VIKDEEIGAENKKAHPVGRAGLGAGVSNALLGSHPDTCNLAATRGAVVEMHMMQDWRAHDGEKASGERSDGQLSAENAAIAGQFLPPKIAF
jgi:hypothetical protein